MKTNSQLQLYPWLYVADIDGDGIDEFLRINGEVLSVYKPDFELTHVLTHVFSSAIKRILVGRFDSVASNSIGVILENGTLELWGISPDKKALWWGLTQDSFISSAEEYIVGNFNDSDLDDILVYNPALGTTRLYAKGESGFFSSVENYVAGNMAPEQISNKLLLAGCFRPGSKRSSILAIDKAIGGFKRFDSVTDQGTHTFWWAFSVQGIFSPSSEVLVANLTGNSTDSIVIREAQTGQYTFYQADLYEDRDELIRLDSPVTGQLPVMAMRGNLRFYQLTENNRQDTLFFVDNSIIRTDAANDGSTLTYWWSYTSDHIFGVHSHGAGPMNLLPEVTPPAEAPLSSVMVDIHYDPPRAFVEDYWDWTAELSGPFVSVHSARLIPQLRTIAAARNAERSLILATLERIRVNRTGGSIQLSNAMADLAVSGREAFAHFVSIRPNEEMLLPSIFHEPNLPSGLTPEEARVALRAVLDRAYDVMLALRGGPLDRIAKRPALEWIAVSGEDDAPHAPVNIPCTADCMGEINIPGLGIPVICRSALKLPVSPPQSFSPGPRSFPEAAWNQFNDLLGENRNLFYDDLILYVHGLGSRLEEGDEFKQILIEECGKRGRRVAVLSIDLPGFGYSSRLDLDSVVQGRPAHFDIQNPLHSSSFPLLNLFRNAIENLSGTISGGIQYVIGGSLGGNLALRLAETRQEGGYILPAVLRRFVSWSPASIWESWERSRILVAPWDRGVHIDLAKHELVRRSRDEMNTGETANSRHKWFDWIQQGTEIWPIHVEGWMPGEAVKRNSLLFLAETYSSEWRRIFWAASHEQLIFSHQEPLSQEISTGQPAYSFKTINRPLFILSGANDGGGPDRGGFSPFNYYGNVEKLSRESPHVPGQRMLLRHVGHSIHDERPRFLSREIARFLF